MRLSRERDSVAAVAVPVICVCVSRLDLFHASYIDPAEPGTKTLIVSGMILGFLLVRGMISLIQFHHRAFSRFARPHRRTFIVPRLRSLLRKGRIDLVGRPLGAVFAEKVSDNGVRRWSFRRIFVSLRR